MAVSIAAHAEDPVPVEITTVGLVCDGQFEVITGGVDTQAEEMFDGPVHLALWRATVILSRCACRHLNVAC